MNGESGMTDFNLAEFLPYRFSVVAQKMSREFESRYCDRFGIRVAEWRIVAHLSQTGAASMREIERRVDLHKSRVSRAARRLELAGYVSRKSDPGDNRLVELRLTAKGVDMMKELAPLASQYQEELLAKIGSGREDFDRAIGSLLGPDQ